VNTDLDKISALRAALPPEGLFAEKEWLLSPEPFPLDAATIDELEKLGHRLNLFQRACNDLYHLSAQGRQPRWVADYLDRGKPRELIEIGREKKLRDHLPQVIRPDIVLTESGFAISELDSVPGGIGLTAWLNQTYARLGANVVGGADGMIDGFRSIFPDGDIVVSREAATYKPEMQWLARELRARGAAIEVHDAENYNPQSAAERSETGRPSFSESNRPIRNPQSIYRFFELFDLPNIGSAPALVQSVLRGEVRVTPPFKAYIEEKMWLALLWLRPLREFWRRALRENHFLKLQEMIPYSWVVDPAPLPQHAVIPRLEINDWRELAEFSQAQRALVLKISGFSELAWGSRAVFLGQDLPHPEWRAAIERALAGFDTHPYILQQFHKGRLVEHPYFDPATGSIRIVQGRVRLCPYYFIAEGKAKLGGILATICPADKKLLHGMKDAIMAPCCVRDERQRA
jgi:hypothetical protein